MPSIRLTFMSRRGWPGAILAIGLLLVALAGIFLLMLLPAIVFGVKLTPAAAEESIRDYYLSRAALRLQEEHGKASSDGRRELEARYTAEVEQIKTIRFVSTDVDTVIFSAFKLNRSFVVRTELQGRDQPSSVRYFCFYGTYLTRECGTWNWYLAW